MIYPKINTNLNGLNKGITRYVFMILDIWIMFLYVYKVKGYIGIDRMTRFKERGIKNVSRYRF